MADHHEVEDPDVQPAIPAGDRSTAPQSEYSLRDVGVGVVVLAAGLAVTFGLALTVGL